LLLALLTLSDCFTAAASASTMFPPFMGSQHSDHLGQLSVPIIIGATLHSNPLDQPTRHEIYFYIKENPGVHFRGICDALGLSVGVVQYHLSVLEKAGLITSYADGQNVRYFDHSYAAKTDLKLVSLMRHDTTAQILTILAQNKSALHRDIANTLGISSQALTWQMNQLKNAGLISAEKVGVNVRYGLSDAEVCGAILSLSGQFKSN
jgi:predicted transcriptional regulator